MEQKEIIIGKWYMISEYGFDHYIKGKAVEVVKDYVVLKFYWGGLFRSRQTLPISSIIGQCKKPRLFSNY